MQLRPAESDSRPVRRQFQLARADLDAGELPDHRIAAEIPSLLRRRFQDRMPDRLGQVADHRAGRRRTVAPADAHLSARTRTASGRCCAITRSCSTIRISATTFCSTNIFTATTGAASAPRIRPAGPGWSRSCSCRGCATKLQAQRGALSSLALKIFQFETHGGRHERRAGIQDRSPGRGMEEAAAARDLRGHAQARHRTRRHEPSQR